MSRQMCSICGRIDGFAICLQFHVNRYSTPFTAATEICSASIDAFSGKGTPAIRESANEVTSSEISSSGIPFEIRQTFLGSNGIAIGTFIDDKSRNKQVKVMAMAIPPVVSCLLIGRDAKHPADTHRQVSDDRCLQVDSRFHGRCPQEFLPWP